MLAATGDNLVLTCQRFLSSHDGRNRCKLGEMKRRCFSIAKKSLSKAYLGCGWSIELSMGWSSSTAAPTQLWRRALCRLGVADSASDDVRSAGRGA